MGFLNITTDNWNCEMELVLVELMMLYPDDKLLHTYRGKSLKGIVNKTVGRSCPGPF